jgi:Leucine-rich repeat (LRR) protein
LQNLKDLDISNNTIEEFDLKLADLPNLKLLYLNNNAVDKKSPSYTPFRTVFENLRARQVVVSD